MGSSCRKILPTLDADFDVTDDRNPTAKAAVELVGSWQAARRDLWNFDAAHYGPNWKKFQTVFENTRCNTSVDATTSFQYGDMISGTGQWFQGDMPGHYTGRSKVTVDADRHVMVGVESKLSLKLIDGNFMEVTYTFQNGPAPGLSITEYYTREIAQVLQAYYDGAELQLSWLSGEKVCPIRADTDERLSNIRERLATELQSGAFEVVFPEGTCLNSILKQDPFATIASAFEGGLQWSYDHDVFE